MTRRFLTANAVLSVAIVGYLASFALTLDSPYVVQLHATREGLNFLEDGAKRRTQLMATESGQQFECFLPPAASDAQDEEDARVEMSDSVNEKGKQDKGQNAAFMSFGRAAAKKVKPKCIQFVDTQTYWVYEVCPGASIHRRSYQTFDNPLDLLLPPVEVQVDAASDTLVDKENEKVADEEAELLGEFVDDSSHAAFTFDHYTMPGMRERLTRLEKPLFTQTFGKDQQFHVQFICSASLQDDEISAVQWKEWAEEKEPREIAAFLVTSRMFCNPQHSDIDENDLLTVRSLLKPLADASTCVTRNDGWWTYEFCFGRSIRQFHKNGDGRITAEFSLGLFDSAGNSDLERFGSALVSEHIDATHDVSRPAYLELYDHGTFCKDVDTRAPRKAKVFYYCSQGGTSNLILAVKETQTCSYTVKVSSPVLCDHPHFLNDEQNSDQDVEILHCIPVAEAATTTTG